MLATPPAEETEAVNVEPAPGTGPPGVTNCSTNVSFCGIEWPSGFSLISSVAVQMYCPGSTGAKPVKLCRKT